MQTKFTKPEKNEKKWEELPKIQPIFQWAKNKKYQRKPAQDSPKPTQTMKNKVLPEWKVQNILYTFAFIIIGPHIIAYKL